MKIAIFISGRLLGYKEYLIPLLENLNQRYDIKLFLSINSEIDDEACKLLNKYKGTFYFNPYKMPLDYVKNKINNKDYVLNNNFRYNQLSMFYNDKNNFNLIEQYEKENDIEFDILCKLRPDISFRNPIIFKILNKNDKILVNKHIIPIRHWGHIYMDTPLLISDNFAYGNKKTMYHYTNAYDFLLKNNISKKGLYDHAAEITLTDCILNTIIYDLPGGGNIPTKTKEEIRNLYLNNPYNIQIITDNHIEYHLMPLEFRIKSHFEINFDNVYEFTQQN